ncbi:hypothetical protein LCGC14_0653130 [marine sediment metagenome]|uniref:Uncharacterized protein n=1 Tax=marine sediment metagenome TaxID=412755 RepID=A0A0F9THF8_9ZZZZ|nr:hypothetical protein [bacterium]
MVDFKKDAWLYALIAAILGIISLMTPWGSAEAFGVTISQWLGGAVTYWGAPVDGWGGAGGLSLWTLGLSVASIAALLIYGINNWRGNEFKWDWLIYAVAGILMLILPILTLILESTSGATIGFAPIGLIIAGIIAIGAFAVDKFLGGE